jgi:hypothetical protein
MRLTEVMVREVWVSWCMEMMR